MLSCAYFCPILMAATAWTLFDDRLRLNVRLTPKSHADAIDGVESLADGSIVLKIRVRAVPEDSRANAALLRLVAESLDLPNSRVSLVAGAKARIKIIDIAGEPDALVARLTACLGNRRA